MKYNKNEFNVLYNLDEGSVIVNIGAALGTDFGNIELYSREQAFAQDLERLPVLHSVSGIAVPATAIRTRMTDANVRMMTARITFYNQRLRSYDDADPNKRICSFPVYIFIDGSGNITQVILESMDWDYGPIPLTSHIGYTIVTATDVNVSVNDLVANSVVFQIELDVSWDEATKTMIDEYIRKVLFIEE